MAILTTFTGTMAKFYEKLKASEIGAETQKVTITNAVYTIADLSDIKDAATNAIIVLQAAANPQLEGTADALKTALNGIKYSGAITVSEALDKNNLAGVLALTTGKVTADVSGPAADLVAALEAETTVNALTVTVDAGAVNASDLKILDAKTSVIVDASLVTAITGTAAELKTVLAAKTITLDTTVAVTVDGKVSAADLNTIAKATGGVVTAEVEGSAAALNAAFKDVNSDDDISVTLTGATATAKDLKELAAKVTVDASGIESITGNAADVTKVLTDNTTLADNVATTVTGTVTIAEIIAIKALATTGVIKATLEGSAAELAALTTSNSDLLTLKVTGTTATAIELNAIDAATSVKVNASAVTSISDSAANLKTMYASKTISGLGNEAVTITGTPSAKDANVILKATSGIVTASVTDTAADLVKDLTDAKATDKLTLTVSAGTATAAELKALDAKTSVAVDAKLVTEITGNAADVKTVLKADGITLDKATPGAVAVEVTGTVSAADANTIAKATDGIVTATVAAGTAASLKAALTDVTAADALKLKVTGTATVADLLALDGKTSIPVDAKSVTAITGTAAEFVELAKITTFVDLSSTVAVTVTGAITATALTTIANETFGKVTATVEDSATSLAANLATASTDAITVKVTGTTATAAELIAIDKVTSVVVDAKAVKTITALAADVADITTVLAAKTIAKAADVAVTISDANTNDITALEANSIAKLTTGVVTATVADASASYLNTTLKDAKATDALTLKVIGTTATAADLNALDAKTKEVVTVEATKIEGTLADLNKVFVDVVTSTHFNTTSVNIHNVNITDKTVAANDVNKIAAETAAVVKATVTADSAANLVEALQDASLTDALTLTVNGATATATNLDILNSTTSVAVTVNATEVTGTFTQLEKVYVTNKTDFLALGNENIVITDDSAADKIDKIANATTGKVTATLADNTVIDADTVTALTHVNGTTDVISFTAANTTTTADATALVALAAKVITADATAFNSVATITELAAEIGTNGAAVVSALNIVGNDEAATISGDISAASADAIADATSGVVTATVTAGTAAALNAALVDSNTPLTVNAYKLTVNDTGSVKATDLTGLDGKTTVDVTVNASVTDITGSSTEVAAAYAAGTAGTIDGLGEETVTITGTDATVDNVTAINTATSGLVTVAEVDVTAATFSLAALGTLTDNITGLKTIDAATSTNLSALTLKFTDLLIVDSDVSTTSGAIAVKLGTNDSITFDGAELSAWTKTVVDATHNTYVHSTASVTDYTVNVVISA